MTSTAERYSHATVTSNLKLKEGACDADVLLAAAYAVMNNPERSLALDLWRLRVTGDTRGFTRLVEVLADEITGRTIRGRGKKIAGVAAKDLATKVLKWWMHPTCPTCLGRGHPEIPDTSRIDDSRNCEPCHGTGQRPLDKTVKLGEASEALWLADELNRMSAIVFADMARKLNGNMDLKD